MNEQKELTYFVKLSQALPSPNCWIRINMTREFPLEVRVISQKDRLDLSDRIKLAMTMKHLTGVSFRWSGSDDREELDGAVIMIPAVMGTDGVFLMTAEPDNEIPQLLKTNRQN